MGYFSKKINFMIFVKMNYCWSICTGFKSLDLHAWLCEFLLCKGTSFDPNILDKSSVSFFQKDCSSAVRHMMFRMFPRMRRPVEPHCIKIKALLYIYDSYLYPERIPWSGLPDDVAEVADKILKHFDYSVLHHIAPNCPP